MKSVALARWRCGGAKAVLAPISARSSPSGCTEETTLGKLVWVDMRVEIELTGSYACGVKNMREKTASYVFLNY
jgi:hypothetical protein